MKVAGFELRVDPRVPPGEVWFEDRQIIVGKITGIRYPTLWETVRAWFSRARWW